MAVLKRVAPASAFKVGLVSYAVLGLIAGIFCSLIALAGVPFAPHAHIPFAPAIGIFAVIVCPIVYGAIGGILTAISALLYNLAARWVGGVEVELN
ncbi:MAG: hypothetical protein WCB94_04580 [Terriglobales bacterium]